jgi:protein TonB
MEGVMSGFEAMLDEVLLERVGEVPAGLEQRLMAKFSQEMEREIALRAAARPRMFGFAESVKTRRSAASMWTAIGMHVAVIVAIGLVVAERTSVMRVHVGRVAQLRMNPPVMMPIAPRLEKIGGGGGQRDLAPVTQGHLPKFAKDELLPPKAPPMVAAKLQVEPTVEMQKDLKMADSAMPNLGLPNSMLKGVSTGEGRGTGIGSADGNGIGPGSGGNIGGGVMHAGGVQQGPKLIYKVDPDFSEEARKAKFSGDVQVYLIVDEKGMPTHVRVVRGAGMGLDEKAVEAVRQYRFKPAMQDGKPVTVDLYINVTFEVF